MKKNELISLLTREKICTPLQIRGCSSTEVSALEKRIGYALPDSYREFLLAMGWGAGDFLRGTDIFYPHLESLRGEAEALLKENSTKLPSPDESFIFSMHQGYEFNFFVVNGHNDPPIWQYIEGDTSPQITWISFDSFIIKCISDHLKIIV
ncbi:SMI1/KNR4 family protein [Lysobacter capsici]|uniref:SMI1/KNR4 family protein n=1 Tax=Lysobacter capsici TaxID=435897 RepID=UPI001781E99C|nr:SMI1/KNR4 family protein [Lysobacter capsici]UOF16273.1 SMI1/KNR4 family protein [Lysobacter capsici]